jgi:hypothetical protein
MRIPGGPVGSDGQPYERLSPAPRHRNRRLEGAQLAPLHNASSIALDALADANVLVAQRGPASGLDRLHTAIHDYLKDACSKANVPLAENASLEDAFTRLRAGHPKF